jgi:TonB C terminal
MLKKQRLMQITLITSLCFCVILLIGSSLAHADIETKDSKLKGEVEQFDNDNANKQSSGNIEHGEPANSYLKGLIQQEETETTKETPGAGNDDPDAQDKDLMIEWDHWRNRFLQAVLSGTTDSLSSDQAQNFQFNPQTNVIESKYPFGTVAWFSCKITKDGQVQEVLIEHASGFPAYDEAVREAVKALAGSTILKFPSRSKRISVLQAGGVQRTAQVNKQYFHFGDTEHYRVPVTR